MDPEGDCTRCGVGRRPESTVQNSSRVGTVAALSSVSNRHSDVLVGLLGAVAALSVVAAAVALHRRRRGSNCNPVSHRQARPKHVSATIAECRWTNQLRAPTHTT